MQQYHREDLGSKSNQDVAVKIAAQSGRSPQMDLRGDAATET